MNSNQRNAENNQSNMASAGRQDKRIDFIKENCLKYDSNNFRTASSSGVQSEQIYPSDSNESGSGFRHSNNDRLYNDSRAKHLENPANASSAGVALAPTDNYLITDAISNDRLTQKFPYTYASSTNPSQNQAQFTHQLEQLKPQKKNNNNNNTLNNTVSPTQKTTVSNQPETNTSSSSSSSSALASFDSLTSQLKKVLETTIEQKIDQEKIKFQLNMSKQRQEFSSEMQSLLEALKNAEFSIKSLNTQLNNKDKLIEQMVSKMQSQKQEIAARKMLMKWRDIHRQRKSQRLLEKTADEHRKRKLLSKTLHAWKTGTSSQWKDRLSSTCQDKAESICQVLASRHKTEIQKLEEKIAKLQQENLSLRKSKDAFQTDMKDAFMRGVCALNIEAMRVLSPSASKVGSEKSVGSEKLVLEEKSGRNIKMDGKASSSSSKKSNDKMPFPSSGVSKRPQSSVLPIKSKNVLKTKPSYLSTYNDISPRSNGVIPDQYEKTVQKYLHNRPDTKNIKKFMVEHHHHRNTDNTSNTTLKSAASAMLLVSDKNIINDQRKKERQMQKYNARQRSAERETVAVRKVIGGKSSVASDYS